MIYFKLLLKVYHPPFGGRFVTTIPMESEDRRSRVVGPVPFQPEGRLTYLQGSLTHGKNTTII